MPYSGFIANPTLQPPTVIPAPPRALQPELIIYSNRQQFSTQPTNFANTNKTSSFELPQPVHTVSNIIDTLQDISLISYTSISNQLNSQFFSITPSQFSSNPFNLARGPVTNIVRLLPQAHLNHSFNIVNSSPSFQSSLPLNFQSKPPTIILCLKSPTPNPEQLPHHCFGKQPDTTKIYPTLPLKLDPKFVIRPPAVFGD